MNDDLSYKLGQLEATMLAQQRELTAVREEMTEMRKTLGGINDAVSRTKGGWAVLSAAAGVASVITMGSLKLLGMLKDSGL